MITFSSSIKIFAHVQKTQPFLIKNKEKFSSRCSEVSDQEVLVSQSTVNEIINKDRN